MKTLNSRKVSLLIRLSLFLMIGLLIPGSGYSQIETGQNNTQWNRKDGTVGVSQPERQKPVRIDDSNHPCYKTISMLRIQIVSLKEASNSLVSKRHVIQNENRKDFPTLKTHLADIENDMDELKSKTEQFQRDWRQWSMDCATTGTNKELLGNQLSLMSGELAIINGEWAGAAHDDPCTSIQGCDVYQCEQRCNSCPPPPDPFSSCLLLCKQAALICMLSDIVKMMNETAIKVDP